MYLVWIFSVESLIFLIVPFAILAVFFSLSSLFYAITALDRGSIPFTAVAAGNLWVAADSFWAINDFYEIEIFLTLAKIFTVLLAITATYEFATSKDNAHKLKVFAEFFRKFKSS